jgi:hypothetical protein
MTGDDQLVLAGVQLAPYVNLSVHELNKVKLKWMFLIIHD